MIDRRAWVVGGVVSVVLTGAVSAQVGATDWPYYRHDPQLTGRSSGKCHLDRAPRERWKVYLGGWDGLRRIRPLPGALSGPRQAAA